MRTLLFLLIAVTSALTPSYVGVATEDNEAYDVESEIAWARSTWPAAFKGARFHSPVGTLMAWVPYGRTIRVYTNFRNRSCRLVELTHSKSDRGSPTRLTGKTNFRFETRGGRRVRTYSPLRIGRVFLNERCCFGEEERGPDGRWHESLSGGIGIDDETLGVLSYADARVAHFGGEPLFINGVCDGPYEWLPCASGGERPCNRCEDIDVALTEEGTELGDYIRDFGDRRTTCSDRCPNYPDSPTLARLYKLAEHISVWRPRRPTAGASLSLYKSLEDCLHENVSR